MYYNLQYMNAGGNLLVDFFTVPMQNAVTASLLFDILIAFAAFNVLLFAEGRRLGSRNVWLCVAVSSLVAFAAGFPLFLFLRERQKRGLGSNNRTTEEDWFDELQPTLTRSDEESVPVLHGVA